MLAAVEAGLPVAEYTPAEIKRAVVGYGRADKRQVQQMVKLILGLAVVPSPHDAADALAVAICHVHSMAPGQIDGAAGGPRSKAATSWRHYRPARVVIAYLRGHIFEKQPNRIIVDVSWRRLRRAGAALDLLRSRRCGQRDRAPHPHARARGSAGAVRLRHPARAGSLRTADRHQRHRAEAGAGGALRHRAAGADSRHRAWRRGAAHGNSRRRQEDLRAHRARTEGSAAAGAAGRCRRPAARHPTRPPCATTCSRR